MITAQRGIAPVLSLRRAGLSFGERNLWHNLDLDVVPGEFLAVLGPNGAGKTSLLRTILGQRELSSGSIELLGEPAKRGSRAVGYIPQQKLIADGTPLRGRDFVGLGLTGDRWGPPLPSKSIRWRIDEILALVGATSFADSPMSVLSGGEQQRLRVGQAIAGNPALLLCDEPLLSLDLAHQRGVSELIDAQRRRSGAAVVFVTHDINPVLGMVDRVLYFAGGSFSIGTPSEVLRSDVLSAMYGTSVDVFTSHGRIVVVGGENEPLGGEHHGGNHHGPESDGHGSEPR